MVFILLGELCKCETKIMILRVVGLGLATARRKNNQKLVNERLLLYCQV